MLPVLVKRELQDTLKKQRALWFLLVGLLLFVLNVFVGVDAYRKAHDWYIAEAGQPLRPAFYDSSYIMSDVLDRYIIYREPAALMLISGGNEKFLPREVWVQPGGVVRPRPIDIYTKLLPNIPPVDWVFIITIIFSLFVLILTFDSVSGEKESGTLAIVFSNSVSRLGYLASKYVAIMVISTVAIGLGMMVSLIWAGLLLPDMYGPETIVRIAGIFLRNGTLSVDIRIARPRRLRKE